MKTAAETLERVIARCTREGYTADSFAVAIRAWIKSKRPEMVYEMSSFNRAYNAAIEDFSCALGLDDA